MENIEISKAAGIDKLPERFLKDAAEILFKSIKSASHGMLPNACKVTKLKPVLKKGKKVDPSNYRPILLLPLISGLLLLSKIIEKVVHDQISEFPSDNKIIYNHQSGFRTNHRTNLCLSF